MCRTGGRRCQPHWSAERRDVVNTRRRIDRNSAKGRAADQAGNTTAAQAYAVMVAADRERLAALLDRGGAEAGPVEHPLASKPAEPMTSAWIHNPQSSTAHVTDERAYGRDVEPAGRYITLTDTPGFVPPGWDSGQVTFQRPLHVEFGGGYDDESNWKRRLSAHYGGKAGRDLSSAIRADGFDAIVTHDKYGTSETIVL